MNDKLLTTLYIGIDVSLANNHVTALDFHEKAYFSKNFNNNIPGSDELVNHILKVHEKFEFSHIIIGIESTSIYSTHVATYLASEISLKPFNTRVHILNPKTTKNYRKLLLIYRKPIQLIVFLLLTLLELVKLKLKLGKAINTSLSEG
jgi:transposase